MPEGKVQQAATHSSNLCIICRLSHTSAAIEERYARIRPLWGLTEYTLSFKFPQTQLKDTQCLGVLLGHPVSGGHKYGSLVLQVEGWALD
jgi:hypothetical protein